GVTSVTCTATDECGNKASCSFGVTVYSSITVHKFYDANADGIDNDGQAVAGFKITLGGNPTPQFTDAGGNTTFLGLLPGNYTVTEVLPNSKWVNTTGGTSATVNLTCPQKVSFGNVCLGAGGGLTLGFWSNKNGQAILAAHDTAWRTLLNGLNLRDGNGNLFLVPSGSFSSAYGAFRSWLLSANATNMAYMLSAQLAAMGVNVAYGKGGGGSHVLPGANPPGCSVPVSGPGFIPINALMQDPANELAANGFPTAASDAVERICQNFKQAALNNANNNLNL